MVGYVYIYNTTIILLILKRLTLTKHTLVISHFFQKKS